ncbi:MAG: hypothetical protein RIC95_12300 [Vicingaceae bacterium]
MLQLVGFTAIGFFISYYSTVSSSGWQGISYLNTDYILYAKISKSLGVVGEENGFFNLNLLDSFYNGPRPYHYFDLWGASLSSKLFCTNEFISLKLVIYPIFYGLIMAICLSFFNRSITYYSLGIIVLLFLGGVYFPFESQIDFFYKVNRLSFNLFDPFLNKLSYFYLFFFLSFIFYKNEKVELAVLSLLCLGVANIIIFPIVIVALLLSLSFMFYKKKLGRQKFYKNLRNIFLVAFLLLGFYTLNKSESPGLAGAEIGSPLKLIKDTLALFDIRIQVNILGLSLLSLFALYLPLLVIIIAYWKKLNKNNNLQVPIVFTLSIVFTSLFAWMALYTELNSSQIFYNSSISLLNVFSIIAFIWWFKQLKADTHYLRKGIVSTLLIVAISTNVAQYFEKSILLKENTHTNEYLTKLYKTIQEGELVASLKAKEDMMKMHSKYNAVYPLGNYLFLFDKDVNSINIGDLRTPIDSSSHINHKRSLKAISNGFFYKYAQENRTADQEIEEVEFNFLHDFEISHLILSKKADVPTYLEKHATMITKDSLSGERFYEIDLSHVQ